MNEQQNQNPQPQQGGSVPPPPSADEQVGVRTKETDVESVAQSGGGAPQSQVFSASEAVGDNSNQEPSFSSPESTPSQVDFSPDDFFGGDNLPPSQPGDQGGSSPSGGGSSPFKTILLVIGIIIIAAAVGFGVYYLVTSLSSPDIEQPTPTPTLPTQEENEEETPEPTPTPTSIIDEIEETPSPTPTPEPLTHSSRIQNPDAQEALVVESISRDGFEQSLSSVAQDPLVFGNVKDVSFQTSEGTFVSSNDFLSAYFPSVASSLSQYIEDDFTTWIFGDKAGGNKFGAIFTLTPSVVTDDVRTSVASLETQRADIQSFFLQSVSENDEAVFEEAPIEGISVRYIPFSLEDQYVFEYAFIASEGERHLVFTTSYRQMVDILDRLSAEDVSSIVPVSIEPTPSPTPSPEETEGEE